MTLGFMRLNTTTNPTKCNCVALWNQNFVIFYDNLGNFAVTSKGKREHFLRTKFFYLPQNDEQGSLYPGEQHKLTRV